MKQLLLSIVTILGFSLLNAQKIVKSPVNQPQSVEIGNENNQFLKRKVAVSRFSNETKYAKGLFYDKANDPLGKQALDILSTKLASSGKFILLERESLDAVLAESKIDNSISFQKVGADFIIVGSITEFGRKHVGSTKLFSKAKTQIVEAGVSLRLIDSRTGQIIYSEEAKGEAQTTTKKTLGLGKAAGYDSSLADKAISSAISKLVENIINNCMDRPWKSFILSSDNDGTIISGGASQNITAGKIFNIEKSGKKIKNPQTGMMIQLPGKTIGQVEVIMTAGDNPMNEYSIVEILSGEIDSENISKYEITEIKQ